MCIYSVMYYSACGHYQPASDVPNFWHCGLQSEIDDPTPTTHLPSTLARRRRAMLREIHYSRHTRLTHDGLCGNCWIGMMHELEVAVRGMRIGRGQMNEWVRWQRRCGAEAERRYTDMIREMQGDLLERQREWLRAHSTWTGMPQGVDEREWDVTHDWEVSE
jgi:hypothetical protein